MPSFRAFLLLALVSALSASPFPRPADARAETAQPRASLFFTEDELDTIIALKAKTPKTKKSSAIYRLNGLFFKNDQNWTAWINGEAWQKDTVIDNVKIQKATQDAITLSLLDETGEEKLITLKVNQTYNKYTDTVGELYDN